MSSNQNYIKFGDLITIKLARGGDFYFSTEGNFLIIKVIFLTILT